MIKKKSYCPDTIVKIEHVSSSNSSYFQLECVPDEITTLNLILIIIFGSFLKKSKNSHA